MMPLLQGVRILELSSVVMGPFAGQILADLGASVIKVEPIEGDLARNVPPRSAGMSALFVNNNRNKRTVSLNLKSEAGKAVLGRLIARSDVFLHNMRTDAAERLGVGFAGVAARNASIIYCSASGFGQRGRYRARPAFDDVIQAASGLASLAEHMGDEPRFIPTIVADKVGALHAVYGILAALVARARGREGAISVEVPMFEALASFLLNEHLAEATFEEDGRVGYARVLARDRRPYQTRDGWIAVLPYTHEHWQRFLKETGRSDLIAQPWLADAAGRHAHIDELYAAVAAALRSRDTASWIATLSQLDVPCAEVNRMTDLLKDPHLAEVDFFATGPKYPKEIKRALPQPVVFGGIEREPDEPARSLGADTRAVLEECGYAQAEIEALLSAGTARA